MSRRKEFFSTNLPPELLAWLREQARQTKRSQASFVEEALVDLRAKLVAKPPEEPQL
jgi:hypothetical protein